MFKIFSKEFTRFGMLSGLSFGVLFGTVVFQHEVLGVREEIAVIISQILVFVMNFVLKRFLVFRSDQRNVPKQFVSFGLSTLGFRGTEYVCFLFLHTWLGLHYQIALVSIVGSFTLIKFFFYRKYVFLKN